MPSTTKPTVTRKPVKRTAAVDTPEENSNKNSIQVIERMMSLLEVLSSSSETATLKSLAQTTGLHPSTAYRILSAMTSARFVERQESSGYRLGIRLLELGNIVKARLNIREIALPFMRRLHGEIGETVNLGIRHEDEIVYIERTAEGRSLIRVVYLVGGRAPLHLTSLGKLFLAYDRAEAVESYAKRTGLPGKTIHSLTTLPALEKELALIRRHNIAFDNEEAESGLKCIAAPIYDDEGRLVAGLSVSAPTERHNRNWIEPLRRTALAISGAIGYTPHTGEAL